MQPVWGTLMPLSMLTKRFLHGHSNDALVQAGAGDGCVCVSAHRCNQSRYCDVFAVEKSACCIATAMMRWCRCWGWVRVRECASMYSGAFAVKLIQRLLHGCSNDALVRVLGVWYVCMSGH
jgi:hypothetical protein